MDRTPHAPSLIMTFRARIITLTVVTAGWFVSASAALWGPTWTHHASVTTPIVVFVVVGGPICWRDCAYLRLPPPQRRRVDTAVRRGVPIGDERLDAIAADRLTRAASSTPSDRFARPILGAVLIAAPIAAAIRVSPWFLLAELPAAWFLCGVARLARQEDPRLRWARWNQLRSSDSAVPPIPPSP